jgi:hypothetical protein
MYTYWLLCDFLPHFLATGTLYSRIKNHKIKAEKWKKYGNLRYLATNQKKVAFLGNIQKINLCTVSCYT